jgi:glucose dehydrogenase
MHGGFDGRARSGVGPEAAMQAQQVPNSWISYGKNYLGWRYSPLAQITMANQLAPAWILPVGVPGNNETTPGRSTC